MASLHDGGSNPQNRSDQNGTALSLVIARSRRLCCNDEGLKVVPFVTVTGFVYDRRAPDTVILPSLAWRYLSRRDHWATLCEWQLYLELTIRDDKLFHRIFDLT